MGEKRKMPLWRRKASHRLLAAKSRRRYLVATIAASFLLLGYPGDRSWPNDARNGADAWQAASAMLCDSFSQAVVPGSTREDFTFTSSYDGSTQWAALQVPSKPPPVAGYPIVIALHGWDASVGQSSGRDTMISAFGPMAEQQGWLLAAPEMHGERTSGDTSLAARAAQHDTLDTLAVVRAKYQVDASRIYITGLSMGGMAAVVTAAKYPDVFAAAVDYDGISDLAKWYDESVLLQSEIAAEAGGTPSEMAFEYARRSPVSFASNLKHVPLAIIHGQADDVVLPHHATDLYTAVQSYGPDNVEIHWFAGGHVIPAEYGPDWAAAFFARYTLNTTPHTLSIKTDESKAYYWLGVRQTGAGHWTTVEATTDDGRQQIVATVTDSTSVEVTFDLQQLGFDTVSAYTVHNVDLSTGVTTMSTMTPQAGQIMIAEPSSSHQLTLSCAAIRFPNKVYLPAVLK